MLPSKRKISPQYGTPETVLVTYIEKTLAGTVVNKNGKARWKEYDVKIRLPKDIHYNKLKRQEVSKFEYLHSLCDKHLRKETQGNHEPLD